MARQRQIARVGTAVRLALDDLRDYRSLAHGLGGRPLSRMLLSLISEVAKPLLIKEQGLTFSARGLIPDIHKNVEMVSICRRIADRNRETRSLPNAKTQAVWLGFKPSERAELAEIWQALHWTEGKFLSECLHDAITLGSLNGPPTRAPLVTTLYWGARLFKNQLEANYLAQVNAVIERARREREISKPEPTSQDPIEINFDPA
jgi:hypothetical protein